MARTAVMTGATGRIGTEAVKALAAMGINVVMVTHNPQAAEALSAACAGLPGEVVGMSNEAGDDAVFDDVYERFGSVDILIPNHSAPDSTDPPEEVKAEDIEKKFRHQVVNTFKMIKRAAPYLKKSGAGRIILISSAGAYNGDNSFSFTASVVNGAVTSMMRYLSETLSAYGVTVNCIVKGKFEPDHIKEGETASIDVSDIPLKRAATAKDFGAVCAFLASEGAGAVTGQSIFLTGGQIRI